MKSNIIAKLGAVALTFSLVTTSLVSGTYSKYTDKASASDSARVAAFAFDMKDKSGTAITKDSTSANLDIFSYASTDSGVYTNKASANGKDDSGKKLIAPGTAGTLTLTVDNLSEVKIQANITAITETNADKIPVYYTVGNDNSKRYSSVLTGTYTIAGGATGNYYTLAQMVTDMSNDSNALKLAATDTKTATSANFVINWCWAFEGPTGDAIDTGLGEKSPAPTINLALTVTAAQLDT